MLLQDKSNHIENKMLKRSRWIHFQLYYPISDHVLELSRQSENKTLTLFSTVYRRMSPLSRSPILELYKSIRRWVYDVEQKSLVQDVSAFDSKLTECWKTFVSLLTSKTYHMLLFPAVCRLTQPTDEARVNKAVIIFYVKNIHNITRCWMSALRASSSRKRRAAK